MSDLYIVAIDQGTTSTRTIIFDHELRMVAVSQKSFKQFYPQNGWVEHDPKEIIKTVQHTLQEALEKAGLTARDIAAIGITNQRETTVAWNKNTGEPLSNAIVWQCRRTAPRCEALRDKQSWIHLKTGLIIDPYFSATKMEWLLQNVPKVEIAADNHELAFGTIDAWVAYNLSANRVHVSDVSNASRTMLLNLSTADWDEELLQLFHLKKEWMPSIVASSTVVAHTKEGIPIASMIGDQQGALFGQMCFERGQGKCTYGTGAFLLMNLGEQPKFSDNHLLTTIAWKLDEKITYAMEGSIFMCGAAIDWIVDELHFAAKSADTEQMAYNVRDNGGVYFVPALSGLGAPYWDPDSRGLFIGLTQASTKDHLVRSVLESVAYSVRDIFETMTCDCQIPLQELRVDGGVSKNTFIQNYQSTILGLPVVRPKNIETTAMGAACLAGLAVGYWKDKEELKSLWQIDRKVFRKKEVEAEENYSRWKMAVNRSLHWL